MLMTGVPRSSTPLIQSAILNGLHPEAYLHCILRASPTTASTGSTTSCLDLGRFAPHCCGRLEA
jgi:hypothetical protein